MLVTCDTVMNDEQEVFSHCYLTVPLSRNIITVFKLNPIQGMIGQLGAYMPTL